MTSFLTPVIAAGQFLPGTLFSFQPADPTYGLTAVPSATGQVCKNAAWQNFANLTGRTAAQQSECDGSFITINAMLGSNRLKLELTPKGGLHILPSQVNQVSGDKFVIQPPQVLADYIAANSQVYNGTESIAKRRFAIIEWAKVTRMYRTDAGKLGNQAAVAIFGSNANLMGSMATDTISAIPASDATVNVAYPAAPALNVPTMRMLTVDGWSSAPPAAGTPPAVVQYGFGLSNQAAQSGLVNALSGRVVYRVDVVDLYVPSGLEWGQLVDYDTFRASTPGRWSFFDIVRHRNRMRGEFEDAFAVGGKFYGDTVPTDPATFA